jgi:hypothetical protein
LGSQTPYEGVQVTNHDPRPGLGAALQDLLFQEDRVGDGAAGPAIHDHDVVSGRKGGRFVAQEDESRWAWSDVEKCRFDEVVDDGLITHPHHIVACREPSQQIVQGPEPGRVGSR